jgi:polysaccharide chain length determinant protein (PEP-CTERM system associated)
MHDLLEKILHHVHGVWRYRWYLLLVAWLTCIVGWTAVYLLPDQYAASARVHIDTQSVLKPLLAGLAVNTDSRQRIAMMTHTLLSRPNLEKLARMTDLDLRGKNPEEMEDLLNGLQKSIKIEGGEREDLYTLSYENKDRQIAKRVVQSMLTIFMEGAMGDKRTDTDVAQQFLLQQVKDYENRLTQAEERLSEFKRKNVGLMPSEGKDYFTRLQQALGELEQAKLALREVENRRVELKRQMEGEDVSAFMVTRPSDDPIDTRIHTLQTSLDQLLLNFTDKHPDVIEIRRRIEDLEAQKKKDAAALGSNALNSNPIFQQMQMSLVEAEAQSAALKARVSDYQARVDHLREMVNTIPKVEAELSQLNRDYEVNKRNYEALLSRRESATISEQADMTGDDVKFRVIDPPRVPLVPSGPNRLLLMSMVLVAGLGAGLALSFVLYQVRPTFDDRRILKEITGYPVLGSISIIRTPEMRQKQLRALATFSVAGFVLLIVYGGLMGVYALDLNIVGDIVKLVGKKS